MKESVGQRISMRRKELGLSQAELASKCDVHAMTVSKWERDEIKPDRKIFLLCQALEKPASWILYSEVDSAESPSPSNVNELDDAMGKLRVQFHMESLSVFRDAERSLESIRLGIQKLPTQEKKAASKQLEHIRIALEVLSECHSEIYVLDPYVIDIEPISKWNAHITHARDALNAIRQKVAEIK